MKEIASLQLLTQVKGCGYLATVHGITVTLK
jgi:hypothetical protein